MKRYRVEFTRDARQDIIAYAQYIANREQDDRHALA
jgi:plasmid stabilization system protein ParE